MFKSLANMLRRKPAEKTAPGGGAVAAADEHAHIYQELAMTEELRDALFPKHTQMVSAIFERPLTPLGRPPSAPPPPASASDGGGFSIPL